MAAALLRRKNNSKPEWSNTGSFVNKPTRGWLHPDHQLLPNAGVCYGVRYIGCMEVKQAMKSLDFDTRTAIAKESISRVCDAAGLKTATKKSKRSAKIGKFLGDHPSMLYAGSNVNLTITTDSLNMVVMETGETIGDHQMPGISFASGGDHDTMDFVAYVAKDAINGRACYVLECGGGLAQDVITTIGQAFELRFKQYLNNRPPAVEMHDRTDNPVFNSYSGDAWGNEEDYYNDRPGAIPPSPTQTKNAEPYSTPTCNLPVSDGVYNSLKEPALGQLVDVTTGVYDNAEGAVGTGQQTYDNSGGVGGLAMAAAAAAPQHQESTEYDNKAPSLVQNGLSSESTADKQTTPSLDAFDMQPFCNSLPDDASPPGLSTDSALHNEDWFHGRISRQECEALLLEDGDFLVRESANSPGQYVLSGQQAGRVKHLLLVDPEGIVRTKDRTFNSVSHLVTFHVDQAVPITSGDRELMLKRPVSCQR